MFEFGRTSMLDGFRTLKNSYMYYKTNMRDFLAM